MDESDEDESVETVLAGLKVKSFIKEVKKRRELWDTTSKVYKNRKKRQKSWDTVCAKFVEGFLQKSEDEQHVIRTKFMKRWTSMRDHFRRTVKRKGRCISEHPYIYAPQLSFLLELEDDIPDPTLCNEQEEKSSPKKRVKKDENATPIIVSVQSIQDESFPRSTSDLKKEDDIAVPQLSLSNVNKVKSHRNMEKHNEASVPLNCTNCLPQTAFDVDEDIAFFDSNESDNIRVQKTNNHIRIPGSNHLLFLWYVIE